MRHGRADAVPAAAQRHRRVGRRDRRRERRLPPCPLSRIYAAAHGGRFPAHGVARVVSRRSACDRKFPLQHLFADFFQGVGASRPCPRVRGHDPARGGRADRLPARIEGVRHPLGAVAGVVRHRVPLHGRGRRSSTRRPRSKAPSSACAATASCGWRATSGCSCAWSRLRSVSGARCCAIRYAPPSAISAGRSIPFSQRAEQLSVADFVALTQWVEQRIGG